MDTTVTLSETEIEYLASVVLDDQAGLRPSERHRPAMTALAKLSPDDLDWLHAKDVDRRWEADEPVEDLDGDDE